MIDDEKFYILYSPFVNNYGFNENYRYHKLSELTPGNYTLLVGIVDIQNPNLMKKDICSISIFDPLKKEDLLALKYIDHMYRITGFPEKLKSKILHLSYCSVEHSSSVKKEDIIEIKKQLDDIKIILGEVIKSICIMGKTIEVLNE